MSALMNKGKLLVLFVGCLGGLLVSCSSRTAVYTERQVIMGSDWEVTLVGVPALKSWIVFRHAFEAIKKVDQLVSLSRQDSELNLINQEAFRREVSVSPEMWELLQLGLKVTSLSEGVFDISMEPEMRAWNTAEGRTERVPDKTALDEAHQLSNYKNFITHPQRQTVRFNLEGMGLDLEGLASGYALDLAAVVLRGYGVLNAKISDGAHTKVMGHGPDGKKWNLAVPDPANPSKVIVMLQLTEGTLCTAGYYESYFKGKDDIYYHMMDPRTGKPLLSAVAAAVYLDRPEDGREGTWADALSSVLLVGGKSQGMELLERYKGAAGVLVTKSKKGLIMVKLSERMKALTLAR